MGMREEGFEEAKEVVMGGKFLWVELVDEGSIFSKAGEFILGDGDSCGVL
jgi:hypothetical protein